MDGVLHHMAVKSLLTMKAETLVQSKADLSVMALNSMITAAAMTKAIGAATAVGGTLGVKALGVGSTIVQSLTVNLMLIMKKQLKILATVDLVVNIVNILARLQKDLTTIKQKAQAALNFWFRKTKEPNGHLGIPPNIEAASEIREKSSTRAPDRIAGRFEYYYSINY